MFFRETMLFPSRSKFKYKIGSNFVEQLEFSDFSEEVGLEGYRVRGVKGWIAHRENNTKTLIVSEKTSVNPFGEVLLIPNIPLKSPIGEISLQNSAWLKPRRLQISDERTLIKNCINARESWKDAFSYVEEMRDGEIVRLNGFRPPQIGALHAALAHQIVTNETGTIVMPTGTGKTETMLALFANLCPENLLVVVPTSALRDQISRKFQTFGILQKFGLLSKNINLPVVGKIEHQFNNCDEAIHYLKNCNVAIATMSVIGGCSSEIQEAISLACSHIFIDEAHHARARTWNTFRELFTQKGKPVFQFTATPFRRDGRHIGGKTIFAYPMKKAQEEGYFSKITFISIWEYSRHNADDVLAKRGIKALREDLQKGFDHILMARADNIDRAIQIHSIYQELAQDLVPIIVHSDLKSTEKLDAITKLKNHHCRIVVCVDMLGEGFDLPQLKIAVMHDIHKSLAITLQFIGRFTRTLPNIGEATVIANSADAEVELALEDLYIKDSDWNVVLRRLSEGATKVQQRQSEFLDGFQNKPLTIPLQNIHPKMSFVAYKTQCTDWNPSRLNDSLNKDFLLVEPTVNSQEKVMLFITKINTKVVWGETKNITDLIHDLYLIHWYQEKNLLFINSTDNSSIHFDLAKEIAGDDCEIIRGENVYRSFGSVNRLVLSNLGLIHLISRAKQFTMHVGSDIKQGLSRASVSDRTKSNIFGRGYENGESVTIGASYKGRIWSQKIASDIPEWVNWCHHVGEKLIDDSISTEQILEHAIIPQEQLQRPNLVPLDVEWPISFWMRNEEVLNVEINNKVVPFYESQMDILTFNNHEPIRFRISIEDEYADYEVVFNNKTVAYRPITSTIAYFSSTSKRTPLSNLFADEPPIIRFENTSLLQFNQLHLIEREREPFNKENVIAWDWENVNFGVESLYTRIKDTQQLQKRENSIQEYVSQKILKSWIYDYDIVFNDDGKGEIADIVAIKVLDEKLIVHLFHCKYSKKDSAGVRVNDFYEVCGQTQKSVSWRHNFPHIFDRLKHREDHQLEKYNVSRFIKGDMEKLIELRRRSRELLPEFGYFIVQPGLDSSKIDSDIMDLLGATEDYVMETTAGSLKVISS